MANILNYEHQHVGGTGSEYKRDRLFLLDEDVARSLNKYKNWGYFGAPSQPMYDSATETEKNTKNVAVRSLFNNVNAVGKNHFIQRRNNAPLLDDPETRMEMRETSDCSIKTLVEASKRNELGRMVYQYSDFMYCKHLGQISNNYMVTLRRFAFPCGDHINYTDPFDPDHRENHDTEKHLPDVGRLITWMGTPGNEMSNILKYSVKMPYVEMKSGIQEVGDAGGDQGGPLGTFLNATTNKSYQQGMARGYGGASTFGYMSKIHGLGWMGDATPPYAGISGHLDQHKANGPVDVLAWTHRRDIGLEFNQEISLTFDYELRSYDGINGKAAMLDLIGNILAVTYQTGSFWGGAYHGSGLSQSNIFANLPIFKLNGSESFSDVVDTFLDSGKQILQGINGGKPLTGNILEDAKNILSTLGQGAFSALLGAGLNKLGRPHKNAINSLLSPAPVGFWHLTIGNPWHPIMMIGNLIIDDCQIEHYGPLGLDDFPTGLRVTVKLKHAKPRDAGLIEMMYMMGESRIYTPVGKEVLAMYETADDPGMRKITDLRGEKAMMAEMLARENQDFELENTDLNEQEKSIKQLMKTKDPAVLARAEQIANQRKWVKDVHDMIVTTYEDEMRMTDEQLAAEMQNCKNLYAEHFGTTDTEVIVHTAREAAFGDKPAKKNSTDKQG